MTGLNLAAIVLYALMWVGLGSFFYVLFTILREQDPKRDRRQDSKDFDMGL